MDTTPPRERVTRWADAHPVRADLLLVVALLVATAAALGASGAVLEAPLASSVLLATGVVAVPLRRVAAEVGFAVALAGSAFVTAALPTTLLPPLLLVAAVAVDRGTARAWAAAAVGVVVLAVVSVASGGQAQWAVLPAVLLVVGVLLGLVVRSRRQYVATLVELAENLRVERDQRAAIAVAAERSRIARDMHDVVAHGLTVMVRLADGTAAVAVADPPRAEQSARTIAEVGRASLADMRRVLGVLREEGAPTEHAPQPGIDDLRGLADVHRSAGLPVVVERLDADGVSDGAAAVGYRIVQECLTNAARYADGAEAVRVDVHRTGDDLAITVTDDGHPDPGATSQGSERGLVGIRQRAALYDGSVEAGPVSPHGWSVRVLLRGVTGAAT